jgi:lysophospholipase L1-like esterase
MELRNKIACFLGDSITEGSGVSDVENNRYDNVLKREYGLKATYNYGIGGTRFAHQSVPSEKPRHDLCFCGRVFNMNRDADIVVVYGGINDYIHGDAPIGSPEDTTPATFWGATDFLMRTVKELHPDATVVFMSPAHCYYKEVHDSQPSTRANKKPDAMPVSGYIAIIEEKAKQYQIPVLNLYENLGIDPNKPEDKEKYTVDGLHFNDAGHHIIAARLGEFLTKL